MARELRIDSIVQDGEYYTVNYSYSEPPPVRDPSGSIQFPGVDAIKAFIQRGEETFTPEVILGFLLGLAYSKDPDFSRLDRADGVTFTLNYDANPPVRIR